MFTSATTVKRVNAQKVTKERTRKSNTDVARLFLLMWHKLDTLMSVVLHDWAWRPAIFYVKGGNITVRIPRGRVKNNWNSLS